MEFFLINLRDTIKAINNLIERNIDMVNTKIVRRCNHIKTSNRSKINFIWRSLNFLEQKGILNFAYRKNIKNFKIIAQKIIDIDKFVSSIRERWKVELIKVNMKIIMIQESVQKTFRLIISISVYTWNQNQIWENWSFKKVQMSLNDTKNK